MNDRCYAPSDWDTCCLVNENHPNEHVDMNTTGLEPTILEDLLNDAEIYLDEDILSEDCKCESFHDKERILCSIEVTHRLSFTKCGTRSKNVCFNTMQYALQVKCGWCTLKGLSGWDCFLIRPV